MNLNQLCMKNVAKLYRKVISQVVPSENMYKGKDVYKTFYAITQEDLNDLIYNAWIEGNRAEKLGVIKAPDGAKTYIDNLQWGVFEEEA